MKLNDAQMWERFQKFYTDFPPLGLALDLSRTELTDEYVEKIQPQLEASFRAMAELEGGAIANPDEKRMVGHYWLRNAALAPTPEIQREITNTIVIVTDWRPFCQSASRVPR